MHRRIFAKKKKKKKKYIITNAKCHLPRSCLPPHCRKPNWFTQKFAGNENAPPRCATIPNFYTSPALVTTGPNCPSKHLWRCLTRRILDSVAKPVQPCQFFINIRVFCIPTSGGKELRVKRNAYSRHDLFCIAIRRSWRKPVLPSWDSEFKKLSSFLLWRLF